jgi:hypothetical protein
MRHLEVLVFTKSTTTPSVLNWKVTTVNEMETVIEKLQQRPYKVVAISKDMSDTDKLKLRRLASVLFNQLILVDYDDEATLADTVKTAYWSKNKPDAARHYLDNAFELKLANSIQLH